MTVKAQTGPGAEPYSAREALDAIRLALAAGANENSRTRVVAEILARAPEPDQRTTRSVELLVEAIKAANAELVVTDP